MAQKFSLDEGETKSEAEELLGQMPSVSENVISQTQEGSEEVPAAPSVETDDHGTPFNPEIHTGTKLRNGKWRERKKSVVAAPKGKKNTAAVEAPAVNTNAEAMATGQVIATLFLGACQSIGGDEWQPTNQERDFQISAWQAYCVAKDMKELSPGMALFIAIGSYAGPRFAKPKTAAKLSRVKTWFILRVAKSKLKRELKKRGIVADVTIQDGEIFINGTRADSWNDREREND